MGLERKSPEWKPETNERRSESARRLWADPVYREKRRAEAQRLADQDVYKVKNDVRRTCRHCKQEFAIDHAQQRWCRTCNPTPVAMARLRAYDMSQPEFDAMFEAQKGLCRLCDTPIAMGTGKAGLTHDHDHATGKVRGLLCGRCNRQLGVVERDATWLERAISYLRETSVVPEKCDDTPECPSEDCPMCSGEMCSFCGAGCWNNSLEEVCDHDVMIRHMDPERTDYDSRRRWG